MNGLIRLWVNVIFLYVSKRTTATMRHSDISSLLFALNLWLSIMFNLISLCLNSINFMYWFNIIMSSLITWSNLLINDSNSLVPVLWLNPIYFHFDNWENIVSFFILNSFSIIYPRMFFPSPSIWKMQKEYPNNVPMNMIGLSQTSCVILEEGDVRIFPVVLFNSDSSQPSF